MFQVTTERVLQATSTIIVASGTVLLGYFPYRTQVWLCTTVLLLVFALSPSLAKPQSIDGDQVNTIEYPAASADTITLTTATDIEASVASIFHDEIFLSQGAVNKLTGTQLDALIAHEQAHLEYRHVELLVLFRSLWVTLGAIVLVSAYTQWNVESLLFAGVWLVSEFLLAKAWRRLTEFHADQVAVSRTSLQCYSRMLEKVTDTAPQDRSLVANLNPNYPTCTQRQSQLVLSEH